LHDWWDDVSKIPFNDTEHARRYENADAYMTTGVKTLVGHSLGGAVALAMEKHYVGLKTRTYGAPVWSNATGERYAHYGDPVAFFDSGAHRSWAPALNPHSYAGYVAGLDN
jgi:hypothetical protein